MPMTSLWRLVSEGVRQVFGGLFGMLRGIALAVLATVLMGASLWMFGVAGLGLATLIVIGFAIRSMFSAYEAENADDD
jgi:type IV secretory pathway VirB2 component (pilin)